MTMTNDHNYSYLKSKGMLKTNADSNGKKIEDRLLEQGKESKRIKEKNYMEKLREENNKYDFKPKTSSSKLNLDMSKYGGNNFLERMNYLNCSQKEKLENLKMKSRLEKDYSEYTFHPKIDDKLKNYKRSYNDLLVRIY